MEFVGDVGLWQRRVAECPEGAKRRLAVFDAVAARQGQSVLEIGCGSGHLLRELALTVGPDGRAVGLDPSAEQIAAARARCEGLPAAELIRGSVLELEFADGAFHVCCAVNTMEYVAEIDAALAAIARVLKPGGRFVCFSVLWDAWTFHGAEPALTRRVQDAWRAHCHHQMLPFEIAPMLERAGMVPARFEPVTTMNVSLHEHAYARHAARLVAAFATAQGVADAPDWLDQLAEADREGRFGFVNASVLATATRA